MGIRSLVLLSVVVTPLTLTLEAYADPTGSGGGTSSSTASGTSGATSTASSSTSAASSSTTSAASSSTTSAASSSTASGTGGATSAASSSTASGTGGATSAASSGTTAAASSGTTAASSGTTTTGGGGSSATSPYDPNCTTAAEAVAGTTCKACDPTGTDTTLGPCSNLTTPPYTLICQQSKTFSVYCNGPARTMPSDQNVAGCMVSQANGAWSGFAAVGALAVAAALVARRRRS